MREPLETFYAIGSRLYSGNGGPRHCQIPNDGFRLLLSLQANRQCDGPLATA